MIRHSIGARTAALGAVMTLAVAACGGTGQANTATPKGMPTATPTTAATPAITAPPTATPIAATPSPSASGPTTYRSAAFDRPFTFSLPAGWVIGDQAVDMASFFQPIAAEQGPRLGIDVQKVLDSLAFTKP